MSSITYRPEIDGLRAIAILPVIIFHFDNNLLVGGFIGVDIFFVISGFLITSIILDEYERGVFSFSNFWLRRIRRILPALTAMVLTTLYIGFVTLYGPDINNLGVQGLSSLLSYANISHWLVAGDYWGHAAENSPFLHTWSLSVEEQYYIFFPIICYITLKYFQKWILIIFFVFIFLSLLGFLYGTKFYPSPTFYILPTRAWELGAGAILATIIFPKNNIKINNSGILSSIGLLMIFASFFLISGNNGVPSLLIIPVFGTVLIIAFANHSENIVKKILSIHFIVFIGKISYSLYLWHWPILVYAKQLALNNDEAINAIGIIAFLFGISIISYYFIEIPTRRNNKVVPYILAALFVGVVSSFYLKIKDHPERTDFYSKTEWYGDLYNVNPTKDLPEEFNKRMFGITVPRINDANINAYYSGGIKNLYGDEDPDIVVLGDSHALMWAKVLDEIANDFSISISFYTADGTPTFFSIPPIKKEKGTLFFSATEKYIFDVARLKSLDEWRPKVVIIISRWENIESGIETDLIRYINNIGSKILLIQQPPVLYFGDKNAPQYLSFLNMFPILNYNQYIRCANTDKYKNGIEFLKKISEKYNFCTVVEISDIFLNNDKVWVIDSNDVLYIDDDHLSYSGALKAKSRIADALKTILTATD